MTATKFMNWQLASFGLTSLRHQPKPQSQILKYLCQNEQKFHLSSKLMRKNVEINSEKLKGPKETNEIIGAETATEDSVEKDLKVEPNTSKESDSSLKSDGVDLEVPTTCCMSGCANCVWLDYAEKLAASFTGSQDIILQQMKKIDDPMLKSFIMMELRMKGLIK